MRIWRDRFYHLSITSAFTVTGFLVGAIGFSLEALAQNSIIPDNTLGNENSQINRETIRGIDSDRISGGARRGQNLFHSFERFDIGEGLGAYFDNPEAVRNIFSRVTGSDPSDILGRLGVIQAGSSDVLGNANLFFINPNGILFGPNASLDLGGSFAATTANGMQFGDQGFFSATNLETPSQLLTIDPSAFFFNQVPASITNSSRNRNSGRDPSNSFNPFGLRVPNGQALLLLGGNININGGGLVAFDGQIELGSIGGTGSVGIIFNANRFNLNFLDDTPRNDISLTQGAGLIVTADGSGEIGVTARNVDILQGSSLAAGILPGFRSQTAQAGNIMVDATGTVNLVGEGQQSSPLTSLSVAVNLSGVGNVGDLIIEADRLSVSNAALIGNQTLGIGNSGNVRIEVRRLQVSNGAQIFTSTLGSGDAGNLIIHASEFVELVGEGERGPGGLFAQVNVTEGGIAGRGNGGRLIIETNRLSISDGSKAQVATFGQGDAGDLLIRASDVEVFNTVPSRYLTGIFAGVLQDPNSRVLPRGNGGTLTIETERLSIRDGARVTAEVSGVGNGGDLFIRARERVEVVGGFVSRNGTDRPSFLGAEVAPRRMNTPASPEEITGRGGNITIRTRELSIRDGGSVSVSTFVRGNAGNILVRASELVELIGRFSEETVSSLSASVGEGATGRAGRLTIRTQRLNVDNGAEISVSTAGRGDAGTLEIQSDQSVTLSRNSLLSSNVEGGAIGQGGNIILETPRLSLRGKSQISAITDGTGQAGNIFVQGADSLFLGNSSISTAVQDSAIVSPSNRNQQGNIEIQTRSLSLTNNAEITASTEGQGRAGNIVVNADTVNLFDRGQLITSTSTNQRAGDITLDADVLNLDRGRISAESTGTGQAGDITLNIDDRLQVSNGQILTAAEQASGGAITINAENADVQLSGRSDISTSVGNGAGSGGNIAVTAETIQLHDDSDIRTSVAGGQGGGGNIRLRATSILAFDDSDIIAAAPEGQGGDIILDTNAFFAEDFDPDAADANPNELEDNDRADVNASGAQPGTITTPDTSLIQNSLTELPESAIDSDTLLANSCVVRSQDQSGTFTITGTGGLPQRPGDAPLPTYPTNSVRSTEVTRESPAWQMGDPIVEPEGLYPLEDGRMVLSRECR